jgi:hypothetical protein
MPLPVPEVVELSDLPCEFDGWPEATDAPVEQVRLSVELARERQQQMQVLQLDDPSTTTFALFL